MRCRQTKLKKKKVPFYRVDSIESLLMIILENPTLSGEEECTAALFLSHI